VLQAQRIIREGFPDSAGSGYDYYMRQIPVFGVQIGNIESVIFVYFYKFSYDLNCYESQAASTSFHAWLFLLAIDFCQ
jgi:hypothetical protein